MATYIINKSDDQIISTECIISGTDILADVMGGAGIESKATENGNIAFVCQDSAEVDWWILWAKNEEAINAACEYATDEQRTACEKAINDWGHDMQALQEVQAEILGIDLCY